MTEIGTETPIDASSNALIRHIVQDLFSYSSLRWRRILEFYFFEDAVLTSPILWTEGVNNIHFVYTLLQALNRQAPTIENIVFDGQTAVVHLTQNLSPCILPWFLRLYVPTVTTLHFRETEQDSGLLKIYRQEDSWTLDGLIQSLPLISFWYNRIFRTMMGVLVTTTGDLLDAALRHAHKMSARSREIQRRSRDLALENMEKLEDYRANLHENYLDRIRSWRHGYIQDLGNDGSYYYRFDDTLLPPVKESRDDNDGLFQHE